MYGADNLFCRGLTAKLGDLFSCFVWSQTQNEYIILRFDFSSSHFFELSLWFGLVSKGYLSSSKCWVEMEVG